MYKNPATLDLSVIVPLFNEEESLPELTAWLLKVLEPLSLSFEILMVDDGSSDGSWQVVQQLAKDTPQLRGLRFIRDYGNSPVLHCCFSEAKGAVVITID